MDSPYNGPRNQTFRGPRVLRIFPLRSGEYVSFSLHSIHHSVPWSCSNVSLAPRILRNTLILFSVPSYPCLHLTCLVFVTDFVVSMQIWVLARTKRRNWPTSSLSAGWPLLVWALRHLGLLQLQLPLPPKQSNQPLSIISRKGWWSLTRMTRIRARALSSKGRGWAKSWRLLPLHLVGLQLSGITPRAPPPRATLLFMKVGGQSAPEGQQMPSTSELPMLLRKSSSASKTRKCWRA